MKPDLKEIEKKAISTIKKHFIKEKGWEPEDDQISHCFPFDRFFDVSKGDGIKEWTKWEGILNPSGETIKKSSLHITESI